jgi:hypothetical protein
MSAWWLLLIIPGSAILGGLIGAGMFLYQYMKNFKW